MNKNILSHLALLSVAIIYGTNYSIAKGVMGSGHISPIGFIFFRIIFGMIVFNIIHWFFVKEKTQRKDLWRFFLCGMLGIYINQIFFFKGLSIPFIVLIVSGIIGQEKITFQKILGIIACATGAFVLILKGNSNTSIQTSSMLGDLYVFINSLSFALYLVVAKPLIARYHPFTLLRWIFTFGGIAALFTCTPAMLKTDFASFSISDYLGFFYVLIFTTLLAYLLNAFALSNLRSTTVSSYINLQPLIAGGISIWLGYDILTVTMIVAGALIFSGVLLVSRSKKLKSSKI